MCGPRERSWEFHLPWDGWRAGMQRAEGFRQGQEGLGLRVGRPGHGREAVDLVDVRDEPALAGRVHLLVVGPQLALDGEEQHFQVPFLGEPEAGGHVGSEAKPLRGPGSLYVSK